MNPPPADPEYWKKLYGQGKEWETHKNAVEALHKKIIQKFPELEDSADFGLGATTSKKVKIPPGQKHEADITYYYNYKLLCHIQVSAPKGRVPPGDIWILKGKYDASIVKEEAGEKVWFYFYYPWTGYEYTLEISDIKPYVNNVVAKYLRTNGTGRQPPESMIVIPCSKAHPLDSMFDWIEAELSTRKKP